MLSFLRAIPNEMYPLHLELPNIETVSFSKGYAKLIFLFSLSDPKSVTALL